VRRRNEYLFKNLGKNPPGIEAWFTFNAVTYIRMHVYRGLRESPFPLFTQIHMKSLGSTDNIFIENGKQIFRQLL
jgi:hypothetical protein